jgi:hypothetical protein
MVALEIPPGGSFAPRFRPGHRRGLLAWHLNGCQGPRRGVESSVNINGVMNTRLGLICAGCSTWRSHISSVPLADGVKIATPKRSRIRLPAPDDVAGQPGTPRGVRNVASTGSSRSCIRCSAGQARAWGGVASAVRRSSLHKLSFRLPGWLETARDQRRQIRTASTW